MRIEKTHYTDYIAEGFIFTAHGHDWLHRINTRQTPDIDTFKISNHL